MESQGLKESEAFHRIRKASMDTRKSMREIAEAISHPPAGEAFLNACRALNDGEEAAGCLRSVRCG